VSDWAVPGRKPARRAADDVPVTFLRVLLLFGVAAVFLAASAAQVGVVALAVGALAVGAVALMVAP
jgi:hypothetical protein